MDDVQDIELDIVAAMLKSWIKENWENKHNMLACYGVLMAEATEMLCAMCYRINMPAGKFKKLADGLGLQAAESYEGFLKEGGEKKKDGNS